MSILGKIEIAIKYDKALPTNLPEEFYDFEWSWVYDRGFEIAEIYKEVMYCVKTAVCDTDHFLPSGSDTLIDYTLCDLVKGDFDTVRYLANYFVPPHEEKQPIMFEHTKGAAPWIAFEKMCQRKPQDYSFYDNEFEQLRSEYWKIKKSESK